jgi:ribose-phosphate pyrophosphokinase
MNAAVEAFDKMQLKIFSGNSNPDLAHKICDCLKATLGKADVRRFSDGETFVEIQDNVRGQDVFVIQSTSQPANEHIMEMLVMIDALKRASAGRITAVIPYYGYARQDRKVSPRVAISAKLVADLLTAAGTDRVLSMDLHAGQIQGFFDIPFDHLFAAPVLLSFLRQLKDKHDVIVVSPDAGGAERARAYAKRLEVGLAIIDKRREQANVSEVMNIVGDVAGKVALLIDDLVDTAGSVTQAVPALIKAGATEVYAAATHAVLSGPAVQRLRDSKLIKLVVTDTIPLTKEAQALGKIEVFSVAELLAEAIRRIHSADSISSLFI